MSAGILFSVVSPARGQCERACFSFPFLGAQPLLWQKQGLCIFLPTNIFDFSVPPEPTADRPSRVSSAPLPPVRQAVLPPKDAGRTSPQNSPKNSKRSLFLQGNARIPTPGTGLLLRQNCHRFVTFCIFPCRIFLSCPVFFRRKWGLESRFTAKTLTKVGAACILSAVSRPVTKVTARISPLLRRPRTGNLFQEVPL